MTENNITVKELINKYEVEHDSLIKEIRHHIERNNEYGANFCRGEKARVREILTDLKNLLV